MPDRPVPARPASAHPVPDRPLRWGVLSTSRFAEQTFLPSIRKCADVEVAAVASRDHAKALAFADRNGIATGHGSYEELLADPSIDVVYVPLPGAMHVEWTRRAAEAGKHVLCEKPLAMNAPEAATLLALAERVHIAEGFMVRFHPQWAATRDLVRRGDLGRVSHMHAAFSYNNTDAGNIRNIAEVGGGALYDIGCYTIVAARWFMDAEPIRVAATMTIDPEFGTDRLTTALLDFGDGRTCTMQVSTQTVAHQRVHVFGYRARLEIAIPFNQPTEGPTTYLLHDGSSTHGLDATAVEVPAADQYALQAAAFCRRVREEAPTTAPLLDAIANMKVIDAVFRSAAGGAFEQV